MFILLQIRYGTRLSIHVPRITKTPQCTARAYHGLRERGLGLAGCAVWFNAVQEHKVRVLGFWGFKSCSAKQHVKWVNIDVSV